MVVTVQLVVGIDNSVVTVELVEELVVDIGSLVEVEELVEGLVVAVVEVDIDNLVGVEVEEPVVDIDSLVEGLVVVVAVGLAEELVVVDIGSLAVVVELAEVLVGIDNLVGVDNNKIVWWWLLLLLVLLLCSSVDKPLDMTVEALVEVDIDSLVVVGVEVVELVGIGSLASVDIDTKLVYSLLSLLLVLLLYNLVDTMAGMRAEELVLALQSYNFVDMKVVELELVWYNSIDTRALVLLWVLLSCNLIAVVDYMNRNLLVFLLLSLAPRYPYLLFIRKKFKT